MSVIFVMSVGFLGWKVLGYDEDDRGLCVLFSSQEEDICIDWAEDYAAEHNMRYWMVDGILYYRK